MIYFAMLKRAFAVRTSRLMNIGGSSQLSCPNRLKNERKPNAIANIAAMGLASAAPRVQPFGPKRLLLSASVSEIGRAIAVPIW